MLWFCCDELFKFKTHWCKLICGSDRRVWKGSSDIYVWGNLIYSNVHNRWHNQYVLLKVIQEFWPTKRITRCVTIDLIILIAFIKNFSIMHPKIWIVELSYNFFYSVTLFLYTRTNDRLLLQDVQMDACGFFFNLCGGTLGTSATLGLLYQPRMIGDCDCDCGEIGGIKIGRGNRSTQRNPAPVPLYPP
jgi:hypothetical protein